jgi:tetratricopeptide (TPR) repeat protein
VQVSGQVAVMAINGLLTKVMFDRNPKNEFFVEESFPLEWMYPHLTPFGIIMKINREPLRELSEDAIRRDHEFWTQYSDRLIGNWITYDTTVKEITEFVERVYLRRNFKGFKGDRKFVRDDQAQKSFSKLRSSIGGLYNYWVASSPPNSPMHARALKEADFAFRQALAFCPYSPEAVFRYINLLLTNQRFEDALLVASTCQKLDPYNAQVNDLVERLKAFKNQPMAAQAQPMVQGLAQLEKAALENPTNLQASFNLAAGYLQTQQTNRALEVLDRMLTNPKVDPNAALVIAQIYNQIGSYPRLESALAKLAQLAPNSPEAWYDLAAIKATLGKAPESLEHLKRALDLSKRRRAQDTNAPDLLVNVASDSRFNSLHSMPQYQALLAGAKSP